SSQPMKNRRHISLYAASAARRSWLSGVAGEISERETIKVVTSLDSLHHRLHETAAEILIADLPTAAESAAFVRLLERSPGALGLVALIDDPEPAWIRAVLAGGANAIISREPNTEELRLAISAAEAGLVLLHPSSARGLADISLRVPLDMDELEELTARELQVLRLLGDGLGNKQIAARLAISEHTAKFHSSSILGKLSVTSRTEAVSQGIKRGLIPI